MDGEVEEKTLDADNLEEMAAWCGAKPVIEHDALDHDVTFAALNLPTQNGVVRVQEGDVVAKYTRKGRTLLYHFKKGTYNPNFILQFETEK